MKHNVLTTLLVGLLTVFGVGQSWASGTGPWYPEQDYYNGIWKLIEYDVNEYSGTDKVPQWNISYNELNHVTTKTGELKVLESELGGEIFYSVENASNSYNQPISQHILSIFEAKQKVAPYSKTEITWTFNMDVRIYGGACTFPYFLEAYVFPTLDSLKKTPIKLWNMAWDDDYYYEQHPLCIATSENCSNGCTWGADRGETTLVFDNSNGKDSAEISNYLLLSRNLYMKSTILDGYMPGGISMFSYRLTSQKVDDCSSTTAIANPYTYKKTYARPITYKANNGHPADTILVPTPNGGVIGECPFPKPGYLFAGWNTEPGGIGTDYAPGAPVVATEEDHDPVTLYAQWEVSYTVTFDAQGGTCDTDKKDYLGDQPYGELPTATRTGYTFDGWFRQGGVDPLTVDSIVPSAAHTLYAHWTAKTMNVSFNPAPSTQVIASQSATFDQVYGTLPTPTSFGTRYTFINWFTASTGGKQVTSDSIVKIETDHTLYARWDGNTVVTYNANGGTCATKTKDVIYGSQYGTLATPTYTGYTFQGWYTEQTGGTKVQASTTVTNPENHTLWAHWTANNYTVTFNPNGGTVSPTQNQVTYDAAYSTLPVPTRSPYIFIGWWTAQNGGEQVTAETIVKTAGNHNLWAHWYIPEVTDGTGMDFTPAKDAANDSLTSWAAKSAGSNTINVVIKRTIYKDGYFNTLCLPFDLTAAQISQTFGTYKELKEYLSCSVQGTGDDRELVIETQDATSITAGKAYLISFANGTTLTELLFQGVQVTETTPAEAEKSGEASYQGILAPVTLEYENQDLLFVGEENRLYWPKNDGTFLRGFRAYFKVETSPEPQAPVKRGMKASFGRTVPTANDNVNVNDNEVRKLVEEGRVVIMSNGVKYDMNGRKL